MDKARLWHFIAAFLFFSIAYACFITIQIDFLACYSLPDAIRG